MLLLNLFSYAVSNTNNLESLSQLEVQVVVQVLELALASQQQSVVARLKEALTDSFY